METTLLFHPSLDPYLDPSPKHFRIWTTSERPIGVHTNMEHIVSHRHDKLQGILVFHGNAGSATGWYNTVRSWLFNPSKFALHVFEYPSFGYRISESIDYTTLETGFLKDARIGLNQTFQQTLAPRWIVLGVSLGTGFATRFAREFPECVERLILVTPFASVPTIINSFVPGLGFLSNYAWLDNQKELEYLAKHPPHSEFRVMTFFADRDTLLPMTIHEPLLHPFVHQTHIIPYTGHSTISETKEFHKYLNDFLF